MHFTRLGRAMRATSESQLVAGLMGVDINKIISATFIIGSALAAVAGVLVSANYGIAQYTMGFMLGLKAFTAAVLGGIGNLGGAMLGGLLLGLIESIGAGYIGDLTGGFLGSNYQDVFAFVVLIARAGVPPDRPAGRARCGAGMMQSSRREARGARREARESSRPMTSRRSAAPRASRLAPLLESASAGMKPLLRHGTRSSGIGTHRGSAWRWWAWRWRCCRSRSRPGCRAPGCACSTSRCCTRCWRWA